MADRVIPYAEEHGYDWYRGAPGWVPRSLIEGISPDALQRVDLWFNRQWIRGVMSRGSDVVDIGEPPGYAPSHFYNMERAETAGYSNYHSDPQP